LIFGAAISSTSEAFPREPHFATSSACFICNRFIRSPDHCHISKFHLCHRFREEINMTIMQYIADQRILSAKIALLETDKSISTVAMENGYANFSHFCSAFRRAEGISPASFRKQYRQ
ncbi:MAG: helix-turn-helix transcriptional regulator, partial [Clostridia bacterium]|nr:helix-turn-helix transcriptional regulator [Clostridia bacterium]